MKNAGLLVSTNETVWVTGIAFMTNPGLTSLTNYLVFPGLMLSTHSARDNPPDNLWLYSGYHAAWVPRTKGLVGSSPHHSFYIIHLHDIIHFV